MNRYRSTVALFAAAVVLSGVGVWFKLREAKAQVTANLPFATNVVVGTSSIQLIGANPTRRSITICNGAAATNNIAVAPAPITPVSGGAGGVGIQIAAATSSVPNCFTPPPNLVNPAGSQGGAGAAWNAIASAASTNVLVLEW